MFSQRLDWNQPENALARLLANQRAKGGEVLDLTLSNPTLAGLDYPFEEMTAALAGSASARYEPSALGLASARAAVAADYARRASVVSPESIILTASSSESYSLLFKLVADPGGVVLVPEPSYPLLEYLARLEGIVPRPYRLEYDGRWRIDFDNIDFRGAAALCLVSPNNPTGSFVSRAELESLDSLAARHGAILIADEVFADYPCAPFPEAVLSCAGQNMQALTFCLGGLSKSCGMPQLKLGWIAVGGPARAKAEALARLALINDMILSVGTPVAQALPRLLEIGVAIRARVAARIKANREVLVKAVTPPCPCSTLPAEGGWSALLRVPEVMNDEAWALALLGEDNVLVQPGYFFDLEIGATLVLSLLTEPAVFEKGIRRILARVGEMV